MIEALPAIPVIDAPGGPLQLAELCADRLPSIIGICRKVIPAPALRWGDRYAATYLRRTDNPYAHEVAAIARRLDRPGAYALNFSFELGCTTGCRAADGMDGRQPMRLYRTLDWPFRLGADVVVARHATPVGGYYNITWPGYTGVLTGLAPGRFAAAINQAPMRYSFRSFGLSLPIDWIVNRRRIARLTALPPAHLLRQAFERCATYDEAKAMLTTTPVCIPVIYTLTGARPGEGCVIERRETAACVHEGPVSVTNHWLNPGFKGRPRRGRNSRKRLRGMQAMLPTLKGGFDWVQAPVLDSFTRMTAELGAATGALLVQGWQGDKAVTERLRVN